jgi:hypothetical protein
MIHLPGRKWWEEIYELPFPVFEQFKWYVDARMGR